MAHTVRWKMELLRQDPQSMDSLSKTTGLERNEIRQNIADHLEVFQTRAELEAQFQDPNMYSIRSGRKFILHMLVDSEVKGSPGYFVIDVYKFWRAG
ncbi:MAG: hypothetical protein U1E59_10235 [Amaricoccus sp.]